MTEKHEGQSQEGGKELPNGWHENLDDAIENAKNHRDTAVKTQGFLPDSEAVCVWQLHDSSKEDPMDGKYWVTHSEWARQAENESEEKDPGRFTYKLVWPKE